jgi:hypothetical protein
VAVAVKAAAAVKVDQRVDMEAPARVALRAAPKVLEVKVEAARRALVQKALAQKAVVRVEAKARARAALVKAAVTAVAQRAAAQRAARPRAAAVSTAAPKAAARVVVRRVEAGSLVEARAASSALHPQSLALRQQPFPISSAV